MLLLFLHVSSPWKPIVYEWVMIYKSSTILWSISLYTLNAVLNLSVQLLQTLNVLL
jgi:hypothetical protein